MRSFAKPKPIWAAACALAGLAFLFAGGRSGGAQDASLAVQAQVEVVTRAAADQRTAANDGGHRVDASNVALWLVPLDRSLDELPARAPAQRPQIVQRNKAFEPHVLVVQVGTTILFPNKDPFFHNVFSVYNGKRFDLGLYEAGTTKSERFDRPGVSYLFCNIHAEMSAVIVAVETPYFGLSDRTGRVSIPGVPSGRYQLRVWYERSLPDDLKALTRTVAISESSHVLDPIRVIASPNFTLAHKNKYGQDYVPAPSGGYSHP